MNRREFDKSLDLDYCPTLDLGKSIVVQQFRFPLFDE